MSGRGWMRSLVDAKAAREAAISDLPVQLGGLAVTELLPFGSRPASAAPTPRAPLAAPLPELETAWEATCTPQYEGEDATAFCVRYSPDDVYVAAGCADGAVRVFQAPSGRWAFSLSEPSTKLDFEGVRLPVTCLRWRPGGSSTKRVILSANASGGVKHWHASSSSSELLHSHTEKGNQVYALDYRPDAALFASAGKDTVVRVYDEETQALSATLGESDAEMRRYLGGGAGLRALGHTSRVFSIKFVPDEPPLLLSAGWDNSVHVWDLRAAQSPVGSMYGVHCCGDSVDVRGCEVLTGSWRPSKQLQIWDLRRRELVSSVPFLPSPPATECTCKLYAAQLSRPPPTSDAAPTIIAAAGTGSAEGTGEVHLFSREGFTPLGRLELPRAVYGIDVARGGARVALTAGDNKLRVAEAPKPAASVELD